MSSHQTMKHCDTCGKPVLHVVPSTSHLLHLVLSIITVGFWVPVWLLISMNNGSQSQCTGCGKLKGLFGSSR